MSTMTERAHEVLKETTARKADLEQCLSKISRTIEYLKSEDRPSICPFPALRQNIDGRDYCITCSYYYLNKREPYCVCMLIQVNDITRHQAICGLYRFSIAIKNHLSKGALL